MAADDLPKNFDVIVLGTGFVESILAAAFARVGYSVLHIDRNDYYCGDWASFNLQGVQRWVKEQQGERSDPLQRPDNVPVEDGDTLLECPLYGQANFNIDTDFFVQPEDVNPLCEKLDKISVSSDTTEPWPFSGVQSESASCEAGRDVTSVDPNTQNPLSRADQENTKQTVHTDGQSLVEQVGSVDAESHVDRDLKHCKVSTGESNSVVEDESREVCDRGETKRADGGNVQSEGGHPAGEICDQAPTEAGDAGRIEAAQCGSKTWTSTGIEKLWRKFNIDLAPRLLYCRGEMVELLINSDVSKYCEFKTVSRVLTLLDQHLQKVPCSRADVFSSKSVAMIEKRMMMKFLTFCMEYQKHADQYHDFAEKPFTEFLDAQKLKPNIRHFVQHSIAMATDAMTTVEGLDRTQKFLVSLGRYGNTAFLWPLYGSGELPQCFARMCAVFAGIYCLRTTASCLVVDHQNRYKGIVTTEGHRIESKWLIAENSYLPATFPSESTADRVTSRAVFMTSKSIQESDSEELTLLHLPCPDDPNRPIRVLELGPGSMACPQGLYLVHLSREGSGRDVTAKEDLKYAVDLLLSSDPDIQITDKRPQVLWYLYFSQVSRVGVADDGLHDNVVVVPGPGAELDIDGVVKQAKEIFGKLLPDEEFLPKAPNPEDIIYDDGQTTEAGQGFHDPEIPGESPLTEPSDENPLITTSNSDSVIPDAGDPETSTAVQHRPCEDRNSGNDTVQNSSTEKSSSNSS